MRILSSPLGKFARVRSPLALLLTLALFVLNASTLPAQTGQQWAAARGDMVDADVVAAGIKSRGVITVMRSTPRHEFVPLALRRHSYFDMALPIGHKQTISPPFVVAYMTEQLQPLPTDKVLEIGTGSGYQAAILSGLAREVYTIEIVPELGEKAAALFKRLGYRNVKAKIGDGYQGWSEHAPFDKIIVTCSPENVPQPLVEQLREGGRMIIPIGERYQQTLCLLKKEQGKLVVQKLEPTFFVPMTGTAEEQRRVLSNEPLSKLVNGDFEKASADGLPEGWYYVRQATVQGIAQGTASKSDPPDPKHGGELGKSGRLTFKNDVPGRSSQALQSIGVDGARIHELKVSLAARGANIKTGQTPDQQARLIVSYFDEDRGPLAQQSCDPWSGTFDWKTTEAVLPVPLKARLAIVAVGLLGATGELSIDDVQISRVD